MPYFSKSPPSLATHTGAKCAACPAKLIRTCSAGCATAVALPLAAGALLEAVPTLPAGAAGGGADGPHVTSAPSRSVMAEWVSPVRMVVSQLKVATAPAPGHGRLQCSTPSGAGWNSQPQACS